MENPTGKSFKKKKEKLRSSESEKFVCSGHFIHCYGEFLKFNELLGSIL